MKMSAIAAAIAVVVGGGGGAHAQGYPSRPITMIVPFAAGGSTDVIGRVLAQRMGRSLGQTVIIENVGGADGSIGTGRAARARPDGLRLALALWAHKRATAFLFGSIPVLSDFTSISRAH